MPISVKDIQEKEFSRQKRDGYNIEEVDDFLDEISDQLSVLIRENMALAEQVKALQAENEKLEASASAPAPAAGLSLEYVESAIRFIAHNYSGSIDVSDIAASVGISRSHLYRVFMRHIGTSPNEYLTKFRISQAVELIERSSLPVSAVAASVGYDDSLYFSRVFKKITGVSPSSYIKKSASHAGKAD